MKKLSETLTELGIDFTGTIVITDANGNRTYSKDSDDHWVKYEHGISGRVTYCENSDGFKQGTPRSTTNQ